MCTIHSTTCDLDNVGAGVAPRVMTYVRKRADFSVTLRSDIAKDLDLLYHFIQFVCHIPNTAAILISGSETRSNSPLLSVLSPFCYASRAIIQSHCHI